MTKTYGTPGSPTSAQSQWEDELFAEILAGATCDDERSPEAIADAIEDERRVRRQAAEDAFLDAESDEIQHRIDVYRGK